MHGRKQVFTNQRRALINFCQVTRMSVWFNVIGALRSHSLILCLFLQLVCDSPQLFLTLSPLHYESKQPVLSSQ